MTSAQSCDNCTLSDGGKPEATTTMPRLLLVQHHTPPAKRMNIPVIEHNDHQNQKEQVALFQEERRERCASSRRRDDVSVASPLSPKWTVVASGFLPSERVQLSQDCADVINSFEPSVTSPRSARRTFKFSFHLSHHCF